MKITAAYTEIESQEVQELFKGIQKKHPEAKIHVQKEQKGEYKHSYLTTKRPPKPLK